MAGNRATPWSARLVVPLLGLLVVALASCAKARLEGGGENVPLGDDTDAAAEPLDDSLGPEPLDDVADKENDPNPAALDQPDPFVGATITVTGTVDEVVDRNAFEIAAEGRGGAGFLVLVPDDDVDVGDIVEVTGTVREPDLEQLRADLDFEIDRDLYSQSDRQHIIVAEAVEVVGQGVG